MRPFPVKSPPATVTLACFTLPSCNDYDVVVVVVVMLLLFLGGGEGYFPRYYFCTIFATFFFNAEGFLKYACQQHMSQGSVLLRRGI